MPIPRNIEFDPEAGAMYVRFTDQSVAASAEDEAGYVVDRAEDGEVVGLEFLAPRPEALRRAAEAFGFLDVLDRIAAAAGNGRSCTQRSGMAVVDLGAPAQSQSRPRVPVQEVLVA